MSHIKRIRRIAVPILALLLAAGLMPHAPDLRAQPTDFNFQRTPNVRQDLRRYFDEADKKKDAAEWQRIINSGRNLAAAEWELNADREIEQKLKDVPDDQKDARRQQYESEKDIARFAWEQEVDRGIDERRGQWRARLASEPLLPLLDTIKVDDLVAAVQAADQLRFTDADDLNTRIAAFDAATANVNVLRADFELALDNEITNVRGTGSALTGDERAAFLKEIELIEQEYKDIYQSQEYQIVGASRTRFVRRENQNLDLNANINNETDPARLVQLLIERVQRNIDPVTGELIRPDGNGGNLIVGFDGGGDDLDTRIAAALENGRKQWQSAIDDLIVQKLKFDRETADGRREGEQKWGRAYEQLLEARTNWNNTINARIQAGLTQWDTQEARLQENKRKALEQLDKFIASERDAGQEHVRGLEQMVVGGSDTLGTIVENQRWFTDKLAEIREGGVTAQEQGRYNTYQAQLAYWQSLEGRFRQVVVDAQDVVHDKTILGNGNGLGLLQNGSENRVLTTAEFELRIARKEQEVIQRKLDRAQAVYDYAIANAKDSPADIETRLNAAKTAYDVSEQCYLKNLAELNDGDASAYTCATGGGTGLLSALDAANTTLEEKRVALEKAREEMDLAKQVYDQVRKLQVLAQNPELTSFAAGEPIIQLDDNGNEVEVSGLRQEVDAAINQLSLTNEKVRQNEQKVFSILYEKQNAVRSLNFYHDVSTRVKEFEEAKEKYALVQGLLSGAATLDAQFTAILAGDTLVQLYGNQGAAAVRTQLVALQNELTNRDAPVVTKIDELAPKPAELRTQADALKTALAADASAMTAFIDGFDALLAGLRTNRPEDSDTHDALATLAGDFRTLLGERAGEVSDYDTAANALATAVTDYQTWTAANVAKKGDPDYQARVRALNEAVTEYRIAAAKLDTYRAKLRTGYTNLNGLARGSLADLNTFADALTDRTRREAILTASSQMATTFSPLADAMDTALVDLETPIEEVAKALGEYEIAFGGLNAALDARNALLARGADALNGMLDGLDQDRKARQAEMSFLLDETGTTASLDGLTNSISGEVKTKGAQFNEDAVRYLASLFSAGASEKDRDPALIIQTLRDDVNARLAANSADPAVKSATDVRRAVLSYLIRNQAAIAATAADDTEYGDFVTALADQVTAADELTSFYTNLAGQPNGELTAAEIARIKDTGTTAEQRNLTDYFRYGSAFLFGDAMQANLRGDAGRASRVRDFSARVKSGEILTVLADAKFQGQEAGGLLGEIKTYLAANGIGPADLAKLTAQQLYDDANVTPANLVVDNTETNRRKTELANLFAAAANDEAKLRELLKPTNLAKLDDIFGDDSGKVFTELQALAVKLDAARAEENRQNAILLAGLESAGTLVPPLLAELTDAKKTDFANLKTVLDGFSALPNLEDPDSPKFRDVPRLDGNGDPVLDGNGDPIIDQVPDGFEKPFESFDLTDLTAANTEYQGRLDDWGAKRDAFTTAYNEFNTSNAALNAYKTANPSDTTSSAYLNLVADVVAKSDAMRTAYDAQKTHREDMQAALVRANTAGLAVLLQVNLVFPNLANVELIPEAIYAAMDQAQKDAIDADPVAYRVVGSGDNALLRQLADIKYNYSEAGRKVQTGSTAYALVDQAVQQRMTMLGVTTPAIAAAKQTQTDTLTDISAKVAGLDGRIVAYEDTGSGAISGQLVRDTVDKLGRFLLEKTFKGETFNSSITEILAQAQELTSEMASLEFLKSHRSFAALANNDQTAIASELTLSNTELDRAKTRSELYAAGETLLGEMRGLMRGLKASGQSIVQVGPQVREVLMKYGELKTKAGSEFTFAPDLDAAMNGLTEQWWQVRRAGLVQAFLSQRAEQRSVDVFLEGLRAGRFYVYDQNGRPAEQKADFLGAPLTNARLDELKRELELYNAKAILANDGIQKDLSEFLDKQDPTLRAELGAYALEDAYRKFSGASDIGYVPHGDLPVELRDFAIAESFTRYLRGRDDLDENIAGDRATARAAYLLAAGPFDTAAITKLDEFLTNYDARNASFYLPTELKELHAKERYFQLSATNALTPGDAAALGQWLADEKYEAGVTNAVADASRIDYILSNYYGETGADADVFRTNIDADLSARTGTGLTAAEYQAYTLQIAGAGDALGYYQFEPGSLLTSELYLNSFEYDAGLGALADTLDTEHLRFLHAANDARSDESKIAYVNKALQGLVKMESYRDFLDIGVGGIDEKTYQVRVQNRLLELEQQAERKLGGLLSTLSYESFAFKTGPDPNDPAQDYSTYLSLGKTIQALKGAYTIQDTAHNKTGNVYDFQADLDNVRTRVDSYINAVQPDFGQANNPTVNLGQAQGRIASLKQSIIDTGHIALQFKQYGDRHGNVNTTMAANIANELNGVSALFQGRKDAFDAAQGEYDTAADAARNARRAYDTKQTGVSTAYADVEAKDRVVGLEKAVFDFAELWARAADADDPAKLRDDLVQDAKARLDAAKAELEAKNKEIQSLQDKLAKQATLAELDAEVAANKAKMTEWAQRAMRFSRAEERVKNRVRIIKEQIAEIKGRLEPHLNGLLPMQPNANLYDDMAGYLDVGSTRYIQSEDRLRDRYRMLDGFVTNKIGAYDLMFAWGDQLDPDDGSRILGRGLAELHPTYNLTEYYRNYNGSQLAGATLGPLNTLRDVWILGRPGKVPAFSIDIEGRSFIDRSKPPVWLPDAIEVQVSAIRLAHSDYSNYAAAMDQKVREVVGAQAVLFAFMGVYGIAPALAYASAVHSMETQRANLNTQVTQAADVGRELRAKYAELQELTDIDTVGKLKAVLGRGEFGLQADDLNMITTGTCTSNCGLDQLVWKGGDKDLAFNEIAGSDGKSIAHLKGLKDAYGFYVRKGKSEAGGGVAAQHKFGSDGRSMRLMVSADEFSDALAAMAKTQYEIQKSEYHAKAENFINSSGVKADTLTILEDRESFMHGLLKAAANLEGNVNSGVGYEMYRRIARDYMGEGQVVDQILALRLKQQVQLQQKDWQVKEQDFHAKKAEWLATMKRYQDGGTDQWAAMEARLKKAWESWRTDYDKQAKTAADARLKRIEDAVKAQQKWTEDMLRSRSQQSDAERIKQLYEGISAQVEALKRNLPARVASAIDVNSILNAAWAKERNARRELDLKVLQGALYADVNLFLSEAKASNFETTESDRVRKEFEKLQGNLKDAGTRMAMLQTLDTLVTLPDNYAKTIEEANKALDRELGQRLTKAGFVKQGEGYARFTKTPNSMARGLPGEWQVIPGYKFYNYVKPDLPKIKDSTGKEWDLSRLIASTDNTRTVLSGQGQLDPAELETMVSLARAKMDRDFKDIYDPDNPQDLETAAIAACGIRCASRAAQATQAQMRNIAGNPQAAGQTFTSGQSLDQVGESTIKAGYIVGDVEGGKFGEHHFWEFWNALNLKEYYDKLKGEAQAQSDSGHYAVGKGLGQLAGGGLVAALGSANPLLATFAAKELKQLQRASNKFALKSGQSFYRNRDAIDQTVDVAVAAAAVAATVLTGGAGAIAATALTAATAANVAYKGAIGLHEGGLAGGVAGALTGYLAGAGGIGIAEGLGLNLNLAYSYDEGFSGGVGVGFGKGGLKGASLGVSYSEREGFGVSGGFEIAKGLGLSLNANASGGYGAGVSIGRNITRGGHGVKLGYQYSRFTGGQASVGLSRSTDVLTGGGLNYGLTYGPDQGFGVSGGVSWDQGLGYTSSFGLSYNRTSRLRASYSLSRNFKELDQSDGWPGDPVSPRRGLLDMLSGAGYRIGREDDNVIGMVAPVDADEGPMGADELSQYSEGGALPDGVSTTKEYKHWQAADRAHHILISQNPEKYNNKATWQRIRQSLKQGVNYSDAEIRALVAAEGGDAFDVNEDVVAAVKTHKTAANLRHLAALAKAKVPFQLTPMGDSRFNMSHRSGTDVFVGHAGKILDAKDQQKYAAFKAAEERARLKANTGLTSKALGALIGAAKAGVTLTSWINPYTLAYKLTPDSFPNLAEKFDELASRYTRGLQGEHFEQAKFGGGIAHSVAGIATGLPGLIRGGIAGARALPQLYSGLRNSSAVYTQVGQAGFAQGAHMTALQSGRATTFHAVARGGSGVRVNRSLFHDADEISAKVAAYHDDYYNAVGRHGDELSDMVTKLQGRGLKVEAGADASYNAGRVTFGPGTKRWEMLEETLHHGVETGRGSLRTAQQALKKTLKLRKVSLPGRSAEEIVVKEWMLKRADILGINEPTRILLRNQIEHIRRYGITYGY